MQSNSISPTSPLSPTRWPADAFRVGPSLLTLLGIVVVILVFMVAIGLAGRGYLVGPRGAPNPGALFIVQDLAYVPLAIYLAVVLPPLARRSLADLGVRAPRARDLAAGIVGAFAMLVVVGFSSNAIDALLHREHVQTAVRMLADLKGPYAALIATVSAVVIAPMVEEAVFRVFIFNALLRHVGFTAAAVLSSVLFGLAHGDPVLALPLALGGMVLATVYYRTGCYWANVITHGCFNGFSVAAIFLLHMKQ